MKPDTSVSSLQRAGWQVRFGKRQQVRSVLQGPRSASEPGASEGPKGSDVFLWPLWEQIHFVSLSGVLIWPGGQVHSHWDKLPATGPSKSRHRLSNRPPQALRPTRCAHPGPTSEMQSLQTRPLALCPLVVSNDDAIFPHLLVLRTLNIFSLDKLMVTS